MLASVLAALLLQQIILQRQNTLHRNGRWTSSKVDVEYGILGAVAFLTTRTALHRGRLNLGVWHKFHEVLFREPLALEALEADIRLREEGYLVVLYDKNADGFAGVRLSRNPDFPTACLVGDGDGGFRHRVILPVSGLDKGWHRLALHPGEHGFSVNVDGIAAGSCPRRDIERGLVGFRGSGAKHTYVDNVVLERADGTPTITESFSHRGPLWPSFAACMAAVAFFHFAVFAATRRQRSRSERSLHLYLATSHLVLLVTASLGLATERFVLGRRHTDNVDFYHYPNRIEDESAVVARLARVAAATKPEGVFRILMVGGSQTWGSGARSRGDTWFERLEAKLNRSAPPKTRFECLSAGIPAWTAPQLLATYRANWLDLDPDVVVFNVGHNDRNAESYRRALPELVELAQSSGAHTVLIPEANTTENRRSLHELYERHDILREIARERGVPVIETHAFLVEQRDSGFLWWDRVHLAPFGHELMARRLYHERATLLGPKAPGL